MGAFFGLLLGLLCPRATGQPEWPDPRTRHQAYLDLTTSLRVLCFAAHPDDEDGGVLAWCRRLRGVRTAIAFLTSGEGGQNACGPELDEALRPIRMEEARAAGAVLGAAVYFLHLPDFGYTTSLEETLRRWGRERALEAMVRAIRRFRPHVVFTRHTGERTTHGHHQAVVRLLLDAVRAAASADRYPKHFEELLYPWRVRRVFRGAHAKEATVHLDLTARDPVLGISVAELGRQALLCHRSQGYRPERLPPPPGKAHYKQVFPPPKDEGKAPADFFAGLAGYDAAELGLRAEADATRVRKLEEETCETGRRILTLPPGDPEIGQRLEALYRAYHRLYEAPYATRQLKPGEWIAEFGYQDFLRRRVQEVARALRVYYGLAVTHQVDRRPRGPGEEFQVELQARIRRRELRQVFFRLEESDLFAKTYVEQSGRRLRPGEPLKARFKVKVLPEAHPTWPHEVYYADVREFLPRLTYVLDARLGREVFAFRESLPTPEVLPAVEVTALPRRVVLRWKPPGPLATTVTLELRTHGPLWRYGGWPEKGPMLFRFRVECSPGLEVRPAAGILRHTRERGVTRKALEVSAGRPVRAGRIRVWAWPEALEDEPENPPGGLLRVDVLPVQGVEGLPVGLVTGHDVWLRRALKVLGARVAELDDDLRADKPLPLQGLRTVFVGWRALELVPGLGAERAAELRRFVAAGGALVIAPQRLFAAEALKRLLPWPLTPGRERVPDEEAAVTFLEPDHPVFRRPNRLGAESFQGWVQERALNIPAAADEHYQPLLACTQGGRRFERVLLVGRLGRGYLVVSALQLTRQLKAGVPGAYALLANLAALGRAGP